MQLGTGHSNAAKSASNNSVVCRCSPSAPRISIRIARLPGIQALQCADGATPGTQLVRNQSGGLMLLVMLLTPVLGLFMRLNTVEDGGEILANLALGRILPPAGRLYASQVRRRLEWPDPSELARDDLVMAKLWEDSAALVGLVNSPP
jgi:hypothetical protein